MCQISVNSWTERFVSDGINGLETYMLVEPIISIVEDREAILKAIKENRQRMQTVKAEWESQSGCVEIRIEFFKNLGTRYKRIRLRCKGKPCFMILIIIFILLKFILI